jgi:hypothetical protein
MHQDDLFSQIQRSEEAKREAIERVERHAPGDWLAAAIAAVLWCARHYAEFTVDQVWYRLDALGWPRPPERRAMGAVTRHAALAGWIVATGRIVKSTQAYNHRRKVEVWRSILHNGTEKP